MNLTKMKKCRWCIAETCVNPANTDTVETNEEICDKCDYFYSNIDSENISYESGDLLND